jgi:hypothetical protein
MQVVGLNARGAQYLIRLRRTSRAQQQAKQAQKNPTDVYMRHWATKLREKQISNAT